MSEIYTGNNITIENFGYNKANINIKGKTEQKIIQEVQGEILTGESISVNDIEKEKGKIEIKGNAEQKTREGYNLCNAPYTVDNKYTFTATRDDHYKSIGYYATLEAGVQYRVSFESDGNFGVTAGTDTVQMFLLKDDAYETKHDLTGKNVLITPKVSGDYYIRVDVNQNGATHSFWNFFIRKSTETRDFELFGASPSPDYPSEIVTVGQNIQLFNEETITEKTFISSTTGEALYNEVWTQSDFIEVEPNTIYTVNNETAFSGGSFIQISNYNNLKQWIKSEQGGGTGNKFYTFTTDNAATYIKVGYRNDKNLKDIKVVKGTKVGGYSPYGQGSVEIDVCNKNVINLKEYFPNDMAYGSSCEGHNIESNYIELMPTGSWSNVDVYISGLKANTDYTISANFLETIASSSIVGFTLMGNSKKSAQGSTGLGNNNSSVSKSVKTFKEFTFNTKDYAYIIIRLYANWSATSITKGNSLVKISEMQLEVGSTATEYEEHQSQTIALPIQKEFVKIGDYEDTFIKQDGKWYEKHNIKKFTYVGTENSWSINVNAQGLTYFYISSNYNSNYIAMSNYFKSLSESGWNYNGSEAVFYAHNTMGFLNTGCEELNEWKELLARWNENGNPLQVYRYMQTPELIECTPAQTEILEQLYDFPLYLPTTNLSVRSSTYPNIMLRYNYVIPSPSIEKPSKILTVGQNVQLFDKNNANKINAIINGGTKQISAFDTCRSVYIPCNKNEEYTISRIVGTRFIVGTTTDVPASGSVCNQVIANNAASSITIKTGENDNYLLVFYYNSGTDTLTEQAIIDSLKISKGTSTGAYSSYGQGGVEVNVTNKNILDLTKYEMNGSACKHENIKSNSIDLIPTHTWSNQLFCVGKLEKNTDFTISANFLESIASSSKVGITVYGNNTNSFSNLIGIGDYTANISKDIKEQREITFNTVEYEYIFIRFWANATGTSVSEGKSKVSVTEIQLEKGKMVTDYKLHENKKIILPIQKEFVKTGDIEDTFIKQDGKWYEAHYSPKNTFDGTETWYYHAENHRFYTNMPKSNKSQLTAAISTHFKYGNTEKDNEVFNVGGSQIFFRDESITSSANWKTWLAEEYAKGTPLETYYVRETPELIECTPAQENILNQLENIQLYEGINNIMSTSFIAPSLEIIVTKAIEDYKCYISTAGKLVIPDSKIEYLIDFNESNIPTMPEATESSVRAAGRDGDIVLATTYEPIPLNIVCYTEDNLTLLEKVEEEKKVNKFLNSIKNKTIDLAIEKDNKFYNVKYSGALTTINFPKHLKFAIPLKSSASYGKDLIQKSIVGSGKGESETIEATGATFVIRGPAIKPIISFNDYSMEYNIDILEGARVEIDSNKSTATHVNSDGIRTNVMKHYNHQFPKIENGINELKILSGLDDDMNVSVVWNDLKL